jgi:hypothetical protein
MFSDAQARQLCEDLSLARGIPRVLRDQARHELYGHAPPAPKLFPSWEDEPLQFVAPPGWRPMNHSITATPDGIVTAVRCTCYVVDERGPRMVEQTPHFSRTFLYRTKSGKATEIALPGSPESLNPSAPAGFEDMRIFWHNDALRGLMTRCDQNVEGWPEQWIGYVSGSGVITGLRRLSSPTSRRPEKNWIPISHDGDIYFLYLCDPTTLLGARSETIFEETPRIAADHFRGSSQGVPFEGGWLAVVHTCTLDKSWPKNLIRFVWFGESMRLAKISDAFRFVDRFEQEWLRGYQYAMGLCFAHNGDLLISYSLGDGTSWIGSVKPADVSAQLRNV